MYDFIDATTAARVMGCNPQKVRERVKRGIWKIGRAVTGKEAGQKLNAYEISKKKLAAFLEITPEELEERMEAKQ